MTGIYDNFHMFHPGYGSYNEPAYQKSRGEGSNIMYEKIWLAGLGAYARYEKLGTEGRKLFDGLVEDGEDVRDRANDKVEDLKQKAQEKVNDTTVRLKEVLRIKEAGVEEEKDDLQELSKQIDELSKAVKALTTTQKPVVDKVAAKQTS
ncbi:hypothetical protein E1189_18715 [Sansalvadorimonas verongulae]|nr:hypothetical protein [Sansalvadorimonas verongulae]